MKKFFGMLCLAVLFAATGEARGAVITFDNGIQGQQVASWQDDYDLPGAVDVQFNSQYTKWNTGYQNLVNVAFGPTASPLLIDFVAQGGNSVTLTSFDLGLYNNVSLSTQYKIYDLSNLSSPLYDSGVISIPSNSTAATFNVNRSSFTGLRIELKEAVGSNLAIDNISYSAASAAVPEPVTMMIWGIGACGVGLVARRKKMQTV